jgi:pantoate--beta-alanine ligase
VELIVTVPEMRAEMARVRAGGSGVAFVPTMGALHEGHLSLMRAARDAADVVAISIYVNPLQFSPREDLSSYPRNLGRDLELARAEGVDVAFAPSTEEMQPRGRTTTIGVGRLATVLEGAARPGHFDGVCTIVAQLFNIVMPDVAFFGQKDAQQTAVIERMVSDLHYDIVIYARPTVRAPDGLALSSRNAYLNADERARATVLFRALQAGAERWSSGADAAAAEEEMRAVVAGVDGVVLDYARAVDRDTFDAPRAGRAPLLVIAARIGGTRLIDNLAVEA